MDAGFRELEHTADWELEVWAPDLPRLLEQAARGMYALSGATLYPKPRLSRTIELTAHDPESLLVKFLGELLYLGEQYGLGFDTFDLKVSDDNPRAQIHFQAQVSGAPIATEAKEIKAVTYHNLAIRQGERGLEVRIVFDV